MRRLIPLLLALLLLTGCGGKDPGTSHSPPSGIPDYIGLIRADLLSGDTELTRAMDKALSFTLDEVSDASITVTVTAPDVCQALLDWFDAVSDADYSDEALAQQMLTLLEGKPLSRQYTLELRDGAPVYTDGFLNAVSCGTRQFYTALTARLMEEMEASIDA